MTALFIVATPIGNLADITLRALEILKTVDLIAAEDTRHSQKLLNFYGIKKPMLSLHDYNEQARIKELLNLLKSGKQIALISDAGTPLVSDPGFRLVQGMHQAGIPVVPVPGPCAAIAALVASGLPTDRFVFEGFLPVKSAARQQRLKELAEEVRTIIFYEAPHRVENLFLLLREIFGEERPVTMAREMTKTFETIRQGTLNELWNFIQTDPQQRRGEWVIVVKGIEKTSVESGQMELQPLLTILLAELPLKQAVNLASKISKEKRNRVYEMALKINKEST